MDKSGVVFVFWILFLGLSLTACDQGQTSPTEVSLSSADSIAYSPLVYENLSAFPTLDQPLQLDHAFFSDSTRNSTKATLPMELVREFASKLGSDEESKQQIYYINDYLKIQTSKEEEEYEDYLKTLDIGMTRDAQCFGLGQLRYGDSVGIVLWKINYASFDACPMYEGSHILASLYLHGELLSTSLVAQTETGSDTPMGYEANTYSKWLKNGTVNLQTSIITREANKVIEQQQKKRTCLVTRNGLVEIKQ